MNKRGSEKRLIYILTMFTLALIVALGLMAGIRNFLEDTSYWKLYYARDLGLMFDAAISGRGEMELTYDFSDAERPLVFRLKDNWVGLYDYNPEVKEPILSSFRFAADNNIPVTNTELFSQYFTIFISPDMIKAVEETPEKEFCPEFDTNSTPSETSIRVIYEEDSYIEELIRSGLSAFKVNNIPSRTDMVLILEKGEGNLTLMYYYQEPKKSDKLACLIRNQIIEDDDLITLSQTQNNDTLYFADLQRLDSESEWISKFEKAELGFLIVAQDFNNELAMSITKGVSEYYGRPR